MYHEKLMAYYRDSQFRGTVPAASFKSQVHNPSCGDTVALEGTVQDGKIVTLKFTGAGCVISQAAAAILCEFSAGKTVAELRALDAQTMKEMVGIPLGPTRLRCALLALEALQSHA